MASYTRSALVKIVNKISQTKLFLKCPLSKEFARSTYKGDQDFHLKGRQRCHQLPGWTRCRGTPNNNDQPSRAIVFVQFLRPLLAIVDILTKDLHLFFGFITCFEFRQCRGLILKNYPRQSHPCSHSHFHIVGSRQNLSSVTQISHMKMTIYIL